MSRIENTIFISHRRRPGFALALAIFHNLTQHGYDVFFEHEGLASADFEHVILENIEARGHFLVLLSPSALRLGNESADRFRREIETAIEHGRNIVPVMLEGFDLATPSIESHLVGPLARLREYKTLSVPIEGFDTAMHRLRTQYLSAPLDVTLRLPSAAAQRAVASQRAAAEAALKVKIPELGAERWFDRAFEAIDPEAAIAGYTEAIRLKPDFAFAFYHRGIERQNTGDLDGALADFTEAIRLRPGASVAFIERGKTRLELRDSDGALEDFTEAIQLKPDNHDAFFWRGDARQKAGDIQGALSDFSRVLQLKPGDHDALVWRGETREENGDLDGALEDYARAIRLNPDDSYAFLCRGYARAQNGDLHGALHDYTEAIRLKPNDPNAFVLRGCARESNGDVVGAVDDYSEAIRVDPNEADVFVSRGAVRQSSGDVQGALADFTEAIRLGSDTGVAFVERGKTRAGNGDYDGALEDFSNAIRLDPNDLMTLVWRGNVRALKGDVDAALNDYNEVLRLEPDNADAFYYRATVWGMKEKYALAIKDYRTYLSLGGGLRDDDETDVLEEIGRLQTKLRKDADTDGPFGRMRSVEECAGILVRDRVVQRAFRQSYRSDAIRRVEEIHDGRRPDGDELNVLIDVLGNESRVYVRFRGIGPDENDWYPIEVRGLGGAYFVSAPEFDKTGLFNDLSAAESYVIMNWLDLLVTRSRKQYRPAFTTDSVARTASRGRPARHRPFERRKSGKK